MDEATNGISNDLPTNTLPATADAGRLQAAEQIIRTNVWWSAGAGAIPVAYLDMVAVSAIQMKMVKELADLYGVPFKAHLGKAAVGSLVGTVAPAAIGYGFISSALFQSFVKATPVVGPIIGFAAIGGFAAAATFAVGKVFNQHFATGGTFLTFDPKAVEAYFREQFAAAKRKGTSLMGSAAV